MQGAGFSSTWRRIGAFFIAESNPEKRIAFLKSAYGTSYNSWGFGSRLCSLNTDPETGLHIRLAATGGQPEIVQTLDWESAGLVIDELVAGGGLGAQDTTEEKKSTAVTASRRKRLAPPPAEQMSLFPSPETDDPASLLREQLAQRFPSQGKAWRDILSQAGDRPSLIKAFKKHFGWQGGSCRFAGGQSGYIFYENEGITIQCYDAAGTELRFSWPAAVDLISDIVEGEAENQIWDTGSDSAETEEQIHAPTLKSILLQPDTAKMIVIEPGKEPVIASIEKTKAAVEEYLGGGVDAVPLGGPERFWILSRKDWYESELPANVSVFEDQVIFGAAVALQLSEDGQEIAEPDEDTLGFALKRCGGQRAFENGDILPLIQQRSGELGELEEDFARLYEKVSRMNPANQIRILLVELGRPARELRIDRSEDALQRYLGPDLEYGALGNNVAYITAQGQRGEFNRFVRGDAIYGPFLIVRTGEDLELDSLDDDASRQYLMEFSDAGEAEEAPMAIEGAAVPDESGAVAPIPKPENYRYPDVPGAGEFQSGAKARFQENIHAIKALHTIEIEKRDPTPEEQAALAGYAGWGGLSQVFDEAGDGWSNERGRLRELLDDRQYAAARASATTSFYTPLPYIRFIYSALRKFGFKDGRILEPAAGTGRFFGGIPEGLTACKLYGVELDGLSARIAGKLYPNATVFRGGFENAQLSDNQFDAAVGNVPFGNYQLADARYDKHHFLIHDYFFAKSVDKVRPGGVVAFITSNGISGGTFDKRDNKFRKYIAERCDLIGAVRLPSNAFRSAGTDVVTDILFLQKRDTLRDLSGDMPRWVEAEILREEEYTDKEGATRTQYITINPYFRDHPEMVLGELDIVSGPFGPQLTCTPHPETELESQLQTALKNLDAVIPPWSHREIDGAMEAPPEVKNFTFTEVDGRVYYREHGLLIPQDLNQTAVFRVAGMHRLRQTLRRLIELQPTSASDGEIAELREALNDQYDSFVKAYGELNSCTNERLFAKDVECNLLRAMEKKQEDGSYSKTDIFFKRTVDPRKIIHHADNAFDALYISLNQKGGIDFHTVMTVYPRELDEIVSELGDAIYQNPAHWNNSPSEGWETREEYLSGNVRKKLAAATAAAAGNPDLFSRNVLALEQSLPDWIEAGQIEARLGASWIGREYFQQFMYETFNTPLWLRGNSGQCIRIEYNAHGGKWSVQNGQMDSSVQAREVFGTLRANAYGLLEDTLNLSDTTVKDRVEENVYVVNQAETQLARGKQTQIKNAFRNWVFADPERRHVLVERYNDLFNAVRIREYDGSRLQLPGLSRAFEPYAHQRNAVARICDRSGHTLLDHKVGAGKTATMIIGAYERIRIGISKRSMFVVPNHIVKQFGDDIYKLYPDAKAMVVREADFEKANRQQFLSRIVYSDVQLIVIGHSQFERIPMSDFYRQQALDREISQMSASISLMREESGARWTVKQMEAQQITLETQLKRLQNKSGKDGGIVTFEEMGVDHLSVDEADVFKNCYIFSKLRNVAGIGTAASQRAADMLMKCRYLNETGGKLVFATGTPISNALSEMYVMQRYLQEDLLHEQGIYHFDEWVADFAETTTSLELAPEGNGFRQRTRLSRYFNLPELMQLYRQAADVQTADTLQLKVPAVAGGEPAIVLCRPSEELLQWVQEGVERCKKIRKRLVEPSEDNMLKFTLEAKLAGLDMRLVDAGAGYNPEGKVERCAEKLLYHYEETWEDKGVQIVFCDSSTPTPHKFNLYGELKRVCIRKGIPEEEVAFIHDAKNGRDKEALFARCRSGDVRILIGSTEKCGAGTNIQDRLAALHHLDCPFRPRDIEQREGRIIRQGNAYPEAHIYRYVTEKSFDAYLWNIIATKQRFITQIRQGSSGQRSFEDKDETLLSFEAVQAVASGDPRIMEKINLDNELSRLQLLQADYNNQRFRLQDKVGIQFPTERQRILQEKEKINADIHTVTENGGGAFQMRIAGTLYEKREDAGNALIAAAKAISDKEPVNIGEYMGLTVLLRRSRYQSGYTVMLSGRGNYSVELNEGSGTGTATRMDNLVKQLPEQLKKTERALQDLLESENAARAELERPFEYLEDITRGIERQAQLNAELNLENQEAEVLPEGTGQAAQPGECSSEGSRDVEMLKDLEEADIHLEEGM